MPFHIRNHRLVGVPFCESPFADERPDGVQPELVVVHGISLPPGEYGGPYIEHLFTGCLDPSGHPYFVDVHQLEVSAHVLVRRDGSLVQFVPFDRRAWHAGKSSWQGRERCNDFSIGIELEGTDDTPYLRVQYEVLADVVHAINASYPQTLGAVAGHCDIAPGRKSDPGESFDWVRFRQRLAESGR